MLTNILLIILIAVALIALFKRKGERPVTVIIRPDINEAINEIRTAAAHEADVSSVLGLVRQLDADPDALQLIKSYPRTVQAAALLHYANELGSTLHALQAKEAEMLRDQRPSAAADVHRLIIKARQQLDAVVASSGQTGPRSV